MSNKPQGRKRHLVSGNVEEIRRQEEALEIDKVGEKTNFVTKVFKRILRGKNTNEEK